MNKIIHIAVKNQNCIQAGKARIVDTPDEATGDDTVYSGNRGSLIAEANEMYWRATNGAAGSYFRACAKNIMSELENI